MQQPSKTAPSGSVKDKFLGILSVSNTAEIVPFVKSLNDNDKKTLAPLIKDCIKYYSEYEHKNGRSNIRGSNPQFVILSIAAFVCLNEKDYKRSFIRISYLSSSFIKFHEYTQEDLMKQISIDDILEWYQPVWMNSFVNDPRTNIELKMFTYEEIMRWYHKGYISLTPELVIATLAHLPFEYNRKTQKNTFHPEKLLDDPLTLQEHIWYFFTYPSDIYVTMYWGLDEETQSWPHILSSLYTENRIDRMRLLRETLLATIRGFNKPHTNWFVDLFNKLNPSTGELLNLQDELFASLGSAQTKPVSNSLACIKSICTDNAFRLNDFLACFPALFNLPTKAILSTTIDIAAEIIQADSSYAPVICADLCSGFTSKDESVQKKIAKILVKYADPSSINAFITMYADQILMSVRPLLKDFLESSDETLSDGIVENTVLPEAQLGIQLPYTNENNRIPAIETFEDFLFFLAQAFDNKEPWHTYYVPVYIQKFDKEITAERIPQMEPAFKQAFKITAEWMLQLGLTDRTTAPFFISYVKHLIGKYPGSSSYISETFARYECLELSNWQKSFSNRMEVYPWHYILKYTFDAMIDGRSIELLSTPTHTPLWIDPVVLVQRLVTAQARAEVPYTYDMQLALQRCALDNTKEALQLAHTKLTGELHDLMVFLFDPSVTAPAQVEHPSWWMTAAICKNPGTIPVQTEQWGYGSIPTEYFTGQFKWSVSNDEGGTPVFSINPPIYNIKDEGGKTFSTRTDDFAMYIYNSKDNGGKTLYSEFAYSIYRSRGLWPGDVTRLICSAPYNHDVYIAHVLWGIKSFSTLDSMLRFGLISSLDCLLQLRLPLSPADYLLLALSFFAPDKTVKDYAASVWSENILTGILDTSVLGAEMAKVAFSGWLPLKRFTGLIETNMINISTTHNKALEELIVSFLAGLDTKPLTNLKKMLEIYSELLSLNRSKAATDRIPQLNTWEKENNLKKVIKQIKEA